LDSLLLDWLFRIVQLATEDRSWFVGKPDMFVPVPICLVYALGTENISGAIFIVYKQGKVTWSKIYDIPVVPDTRLSPV
jgi:hypothetical protein